MKLTALPEPPVAVESGPRFQLVWIVSLAMKEEAKVDNEENNGQGAEKEKQ